MSGDRNPPTPPMQPTQLPQAIRSPLYREIYTNGFRFRLSGVDFGMVICNSADIPGMGPLVQDEVGINMSLPVAKILMRHLSEMINAIEKEVGVIRVPKAQLPTDEQTQRNVQSIRAAGLTEE
jgi:hypothetical protein